MNKIRVMIVDDHFVVRKGLRQIFEIEDGFEVVAEAADGLQCLNLLAESCPDVILMDVKMPGISGIEATRLISDKWPQTKVIMLTVCDDDESVADAIRAGARGYVTKSAAGDELVKIVQDVIEERNYLDPTVTTSVFKQIRHGGKGAKTPEKARLTERELEILKGLAAGQTTPNLAETLYLSQHTVRSHIKNIYRKLEVSSKFEAIAKAKQKRIIA